MTTMKFPPPPSMPIGFVYDDNGRVLSYRDETKWYEEKRDAAGRTLNFRDSDGFWSRREYHHNGECILFEDQLGNRLGLGPAMPAMPGMAVKGAPVATHAALSQIGVDAALRTEIGWDWPAIERAVAAAYALGLAQGKPATPAPALPSDTAARSTEAKAKKDTFPGELSAAELVTYFQDALASGAVSDESIPKLLALYGSMHHMDFHNEIRRKTRLTKEEDAAEYRAAPSSGPSKTALARTGGWVYFAGSDGSGVKPGVYQIVLIRAANGNTCTTSWYPSDELWLESGDRFDMQPIAKVGPARSDVRVLETAADLFAEVGTPVFIHDGTGEYDLGKVYEIETDDKRLFDVDDIVIVETTLADGRTAYPRVTAGDLYSLKQSEYDAIIESRQPPAMEAPTP